VAPLDEERREEATRYLGDVQNRHPGVAGVHVEMGMPRREIPMFLETSRFDLVVMMSRSIHGRGKWALGGVADQVIEGPTPALILPPAAT
jgi:nucleotide-binding universal stress UspA family protein